MVTVRALVVVFFVALLSLPGAATVPGASHAPSGESIAAGGAQPSAETSDDAAEAEIVVRRAVSLDPEPGRIRVDVSYALPPSVTRFSTTLPAVSAGDARVLETRGFTRRASGEYVWNGEADSPRLTAVVPVSRDRLGVGEVSVDTGTWALVRGPTVSARWRYAGAEPTYRETLVVRGAGVATDELAYLGAHEVRTRQTRGGSVRLVVPEAATLASDPEAVLATLAAADEDLTVGARPDRVTAFAMPDDDVTTAADGTAVGDSFWVDASQPADWGHHNLWRHEYVHTRQGYATTDRMAWLDEATACYYAHWLGLAAGDTDPDAFASAVARDDSRAVLTEPATWESPLVEYTRGCRVLAALDARIHEASGGERGFADVFRRLNDHDGRVTYDVFTTATSDVAGEPMGDWLDAHVASDGLPTVPDDPRLYASTHPGVDSDGDGRPDVREVRTGSDPFTTDVRAASDVSPGGADAPGTLDAASNTSSSTSDAPTGPEEATKERVPVEFSVVGDERAPRLGLAVGGDDAGGPAVVPGRLGAAASDLVGALDEVWPRLPLPVRVPIGLF